MRLISKEDPGYAGRVSFASKCFDSIVKLASRFFQSFKYVYVVLTLVFLNLIWFVCFYDLLNRSVFRTLSYIRDGNFEKLVND